MKTYQRINLGKVLGILAVIVFGFSRWLQADVVVLQNGAVITGQIMQQDAGGVLMKMEYGTFRYPSDVIKEVKREAASAPHVSNNGAAIPDWAQIVTLLANTGWAPEIKQVPATVINYGKFNNVPYVSFRCAAGGYELNIFGDLDHPAAVQIGAMNYLKDNAAAKSNCVNFICSVLANAADRKMVRALNWSQQDVQINGSMTGETLLPGEWGSYGGWWVSVYEPAALAGAQASAAEMVALAQPRAAAGSPAAPTNSVAPASPQATAPATTDSGQITSSGTYSYGYGNGWTAAEIAAARPVTATPSPATPGVQTAPPPADDRVYPRTYTRQGGTYGGRRR